MFRPVLLRPISSLRIEVVGLAMGSLCRGRWILSVRLYSDFGGLGVIDWSCLFVVCIIVNPNGAECYGLSASAMVSWIKDFSNTYHSRTGV